MSFDGDSSADWVDDELRRVPLPEGLVARLRHLAVADDDQLDAALRHVAIPKGMLLRLRSIATYDKQTIDAALCDVPLPAGLLGGLASIPVAPPEQMDFELGDVPLPSGFLYRLKWTALWTSLNESEAVAEEEAAEVAPRISLRRSRPWRYEVLSGRFSAAAVVAVLAVTYLVGIAALVQYWGLVSTRQPQVAVNEIPPQLFGDSAGGFDQPMGPGWNEPPPDSADRLAESVRVPWVGPLLNQIDVLTGAGETWLTAQLPNPLAVPGQTAEPPATVAVVPQDDDRIISSDVEDSIPRPRVAPAAHSKGIAPAWTNADLLLSLMQKNVFPRVNLAPSMRRGKSDSLLQCTVPLGISPDSYEMAWDVLGRPLLSARERREARQRLEAEARPEDFLASLDYDFPPAEPGSLALRTAAGVSPFGEKQYRLLQVAVQAGALLSHPRPPVNLTLVVDTSARMSSGGGLENLRQALHELADKLEPNDRISLIRCDDAAQPVVDEAGPADAALLRKEIDSLSAGHASNLGDGLQLACTVAHDAAPGSVLARRIVLLCNGSADLHSQAVRDIDSLLRGAAAAGTRLTVLDLAVDGRDDVLLEDLAAAGKGRYARLGSARQLGWALDEVLWGRPQRVADEARLVVTFNPRAVVSYRLIGHEPTSVLGIGAGPVAVSLHPAEVSTALFEVDLRDEGEPLVATADLTWREPGQTALRHVSQPISRWQFADSMLETPPSVQAAAIAAQTAELLRHSYFATIKGSSLARVRQVAGTVDSSVAESPSFRRLLSLIQRAEKLGLR